MKQKVLKIHPQDNLVVALQTLYPGEQVQIGEQTITLLDTVTAKHKFALHDLNPGDDVYMYGVVVGTVQKTVYRGGVITTDNISHATEAYQLKEDYHLHWQPPDTGRWLGRTFLGFHRSNGQVGTANYWIVIPMVFCENRNLEILRDALIDELGYSRRTHHKAKTRQLLALYQGGHSLDEIAGIDLSITPEEHQQNRIFPYVDGIKFLNHQMGCGGTRQDARALCALLAGYITHPNVAGATVLSLGCQNAQSSILQEEVLKRDPHCNKPIHYLEQQTSGTEEALIAEALKKTFLGLIEANQCRRRPAPLAKLCIGLECGGSDGFSGISANPAIGHTSDLVVALGGSVVLSEFPELCGAEQDLLDRAVSRSVAERFAQLMEAYNHRAKAVGSGFDMNPSPGNIRDGLITDAIKSCGAAKKGGTSPVTDVLDYTEPVRKPGLTLLCTPGNDVESTTAEVGSWCNIVLFTTGLGTPTGNPIVPVIKIASNTALARRMPDIIDVNAGTIIDGEESIEEVGEKILELIIQVASGEQEVCAQKLGQDDFIPWKRGVSL